MNNVQYAVCMQCGRRYEANSRITTCACGGLLDIQYDYAYIKKNISIQALEHSSDRSMWHYRELLPVEEETPLPNLAVGNTPLTVCKELGRYMGLDTLYVKDDGRNPTASLKDRASSMAIVKAKEAKASIVCCSSTGNAASSLAGNAAANGLSSVIFVPERIPAGKLAQLMIFGATVIKVNGNYEQAYRLSEQAIAKYGWYNRNAAVNPFLMEGKKTVAFEICEQLGWECPDYVAVSVGDGCTIAGIWKGFTDLYHLQIIAKRPRLISVQAAGCSPIHQAVRSGRPVVPVEADTIADSIAVGAPRNYEKAIRSIRESGGLIADVSDDEILNAMKLLGRCSGVFGEPAGVAALAGVLSLIRGKKIERSAKVVVVVTGNGLKDSQNGIKAAGQPIEIQPELRYFDEVVKTLNL